MCRCSSRRRPAVDSRTRADSDVAATRHWERARAIVAQVHDAVSLWRSFAEQAGVDDAWCDVIAGNLRLEIAKER